MNGCPCCVPKLNPFGFLALPGSVHKKRAFQTSTFRHQVQAKAHSPNSPNSPPPPTVVDGPLPSTSLRPLQSVENNNSGPSSPRDGPSTSQPSDPLALLSADEMKSGSIKSKAHSILDIINDATKWWVSATAFFVLVARHDQYVAWALTGSIVAAFNNKLLKKIINQSRPAAARKEDPGMPSSHAQSLAFLTTYAIIGVNSLHLEPSIALLPSGAIALLGLFLAWLRVRLGFHTADQVAVGVVVGVASASLWYQVGVQYAFPYFFMHEEAVFYLWLLTGAAVVIFAGKTVLGWFKEKKFRKKLEVEKQQGKKTE